MSSNPSLPDDPRLAGVAQQVDEARFAAMLLDSEHNLVWVSDEMKRFCFYPPYEPLYGKHVIENYMSDAFSLLVTEESQIQMLMEHAGYLMFQTPGGKE